MFTSRALTGVGSKTMWLMEFLIFIVSSVSCFAAGAVHRRVEEKWRGGGGFDEDEKGFRKKRMREYTSYTVSAILLFVLGMLLVLGVNFASLLEVTNGIFTAISTGFERYFNMILEAINYITANMSMTLGG